MHENKMLKTLVIRKDTDIREMKHKLTTLEQEEQLRKVYFLSSMSYLPLSFVILVKPRYLSPPFSKSHNITYGTLI